MTAREGLIAVMTILDADGLRWSIGAMLAEEATRPGGQSRPTSLVIKPGSRIAAVTVVDQADPNAGSPLPGGDR